MRRDTITYDVFCETIQKMLADGEKISVRTVISHIGGAFGTVAAYLKRWRQEQAYAQSMVDRDISANLRKAILAEVGAAVAETKSQHQAQLTQVNEQLDETLEALTRQEAAFEEASAWSKQLEQQAVMANKDRFSKAAEYKN